MLSYSYRRRVNWSECDPAGIIFFPRYAEWVVDGVNALLLRLDFHPTAKLPDGAMRGLPCISYDVRFHVPAKLFDEVIHRITVAKVGNTSVAFRHDFLRDDVCLAEANDTRVFVLSEADKTAPVAIPQELRAKLEDGTAAIESPIHHQ